MSSKERNSPFPPVVILGICTSPMLLNDVVHAVVSVLGLVGWQQPLDREGMAEFIFPHV